jgi:DNA-binding CsgD family transcriptional regulator
MPSPELLIDAIYDTVLDPTAPRRMANLLRDRYEVASAILGIYGPGGRVLRMLAAGYDASEAMMRERVALYEKRYRARDFIMMVKGDTVSLQNMGAHYRSHPFYAEFLRSIGCDHINLIRIPYGELTFGISLIRGAEDASFSEDATREFFDLAPHFRRATRLYRRLAETPSISPTDALVFGEVEGEPTLETVSGPGERRRPASAVALSQAERDIVRMLRSGMKLREIAKLRGVSYETVRTQVKRALAKSGARSQAHLVGLLP